MILQLLIFSSVQYNLFYHFIMSCCLVVVVLLAMWFNWLIPVQLLWLGVNNSPLARASRCISTLLVCKQYQGVESMDWSDPKTKQEFIVVGFILERLQCLCLHVQLQLSPRFLSTRRDLRNYGAHLSTASKALNCGVTLPALAYKLTGCMGVSMIVWFKAHWSTKLNGDVENKENERFIEGLTSMLMLLFIKILGCL